MVMQLLMPHFVEEGPLMTRKLKRTSKYVNLLGAKLNAGSNNNKI